MDQVIGEWYSDMDCRFSEVRTRETKIGNLITDLMRAYAKADVALLNR